MPDVSSRKNALTCCCARLKWFVPNSRQARVVFAGQHNIPYENYRERHAELLQRWRDQILFLGVLNGRPGHGELLRCL